MARSDFTVIINLSNFFSDHRHRARIFINENIKTIQDFQDKITEVFGVKNFFLTTQNEFLPPTEDVRIVRGDEIIWLIPSKNNNDVSEHSNGEQLPCTKRKTYSLNSTLDMLAPIKKRQKKNSIHIQDDEIAEEPKKKKKKKHRESIEVVDPEEIEENILKSSKKKKNGCLQDISNPRIQENEDIPRKKKKENGKKTENSDENCNKNKTKNDYLQDYVNDYQVSVGNVLPNNISYKKSTNILPTITDQYIKEKKINIVKIDYITKPNPEILISKPPPDSPTVNPTTIENSDNKQLENEKPSNNMDCDTSDCLQNESELKSEPTNRLVTIPATKYFFFNTPSSKEKRVKEKNKAKKSNMFKLKDSMCGVGERSVKIEAEVITEEMGNGIAVGEEEKEGTKEVPQSNLTNGFTENHISPIYNQPTEIISEPTPETVPCKSRIAESTMDESVSYSLFNNDSLENSYQDISQISSCITNVLDSSATYSNYFGLSGVARLSRGKSAIGKQISGVGQLLDSIRSSEPASIADSSATSDASEFVTKRKRHRTRSRRKNKNEPEIKTPPLPPVMPKPLTVDACPKIHIKFSDDEGNDDSYITIESDGGDVQVMEDNIFKAPLFTAEMVPKVDDIIAFKVLKISDNFTPEVSTYIIGRVKNYSPETKALNLEITFGIEQFDSPKGKLSLETGEDKRHSSLFKECLWSDLIEPRLLYP